MRKLTVPISILILLLTLFQYHSNLGGFLKLAYAQPYTYWCVAKPSSSTGQLIANLDYACGQVDCSLIQEGNTCFYPNTYFHHASFAMNLYFQNNVGNATSTCDFGNSGLISLTDPSYDSCSYYSGIVVDYLPQNQTLDTDTWCVAKPSVEDHLLQQNINFACNHVNCGAIQVGGSCFAPPTLRNHASFAMNLYYQNSGRRNSSCDFMGTGLVVTKNPSYANCSYESNYPIGYLY